MKALILAAGKGTRMGALTERLPKPLLRVGATTLIERQIQRLRSGGFTDIVINVAHLGHLIEERLGDGGRYGVRIEYSEEGETPLETGGGILKALGLIGEAPFAVVNADIWTDYDFRQLIQVPSGLAHLVLVDNPTHHPQGDFFLRGDGLIGLTPGGSGSERMTFTGIAVYRPALFTGVPERIFPLGPLLGVAAERGAVTGERFDGYWTDVGTPERLAAVVARQTANGGGDEPPQPA